MLIPGISPGIAPDRHLDVLLADVDSVKRALDTLSFLRGPLHLASPLRIGDLEISIVPNQDNQSAIDVRFRNTRSGSDPVVVWTIT